MTKQYPSREDFSRVIEQSPADILLLIPIVQLPESNVPVPCLHLVHLGNELTVCNVGAVQACYCCSRPVCVEHQSPRVYVESVDGGRRNPLCKTCALLPEHLIHGLCAFRRTIHREVASLHSGGVEA